MVRVVILVRVFHLVRVFNLVRVFSLVRVVCLVRVFSWSGCTAKNLISYLYKVILTLVQSDLFLVLKCKSYNAKIPSPANNQ